ncbi:phosphodiester glycosidase family protein [Roseisolibacter sp. H3M3-2]|uniref:phosphodiester glycosidase family protein n=1 Tax=Roseisolibacter sp. H3M3-2 TaxID=3031323 RepID=UPI0023DB7152|nr:phosphodiester glycosidase family protein [Roseisolibacter sp. H3M3-2]MDF1505925.1 phosphodiester glycosidase family protein [Roseisolibacter sp. H3M3-2]
MTLGAPARLALAALLLGGTPPAPLRVHVPGRAPVAWWWSDRAGADADARLAGAAFWRADAPGLETAELVLDAPGEGGIAALGRVRLVLARVDPARHALRLVAGAPPGSPWDVDDAPAAARLAVNAGQFTDDGPWGWVVRDGRELPALAPGPLSAALVVGTDGAVRIADAAELAVARAEAARALVREAVQSYPALLAGDGEVPAPLRAADRGVDLAHRDARLAVGTLRDGRVLVILTRFDALGPGAPARVPLGLTVPEMAAVAGGLGARRAVLLDGGLSAQLLVRDAGGATRRWPGTRHVPLGLVAVPR